jgi:hypothetical protein
MKTCTELGLTFDYALVEKFATLLQQGYRKEAVVEKMALPQNLFDAVVQAYFAEDGAGL